MIHFFWQAVLHPLQMLVIKVDVFQEKTTSFIGFLQFAGHRSRVGTFFQLMENNMVGNNFFYGKLNSNSPPNFKGD